MSPQESDDVAGCSCLQFARPATAGRPKRHAVLLSPFMPIRLGYRLACIRGKHFPAVLNPTPKIGIVFPPTAIPRRSPQPLPCVAPPLVDSCLYARVPRLSH